MARLHGHAAAAHWLDFPGVGWNIDGKYADAVLQLMGESGFRHIRLELGWGTIMGWDEKFIPQIAERTRPFLQMCKKHNIRPLILLNAHHAGPGPHRGIPVELVADAKAGDRVLQVRDATKIRVGYTGPMNAANYSVSPLVSKVDDDGTLHLSAPLGSDLKAGQISLVELKYRPFQGVKLKGGTPEENARVAAEAQATFDGWMNTWPLSATSRAKR